MNVEPDYELTQDQWEVRARLPEYASGRERNQLTKEVYVGGQGQQREHEEYAGNRDSSGGDEAN